MWGKDVADSYDATSAMMFEPTMLDPVVELLAELADGGPALELAIGTGRIALPLIDRGVEVHGIELSPHMVDQLRVKPGGEMVDVVVGDIDLSEGERTLRPGVPGVEHDHERDDPGRTDGRLPECGRAPRTRWPVRRRGDRAAAPPGSSG